MSDLLFGVKFREVIDQARARLSLADIFSLSKVSQPLISSSRQRQGVLSFENTVRSCRALDIDLNTFIDFEPRENDILLNSYEDKSLSFSKQFWLITETVVKKKGWSWRYVSSSCHVPSSTISTAKNDDRTLPFDITLTLFKGLQLSPQAVADKIVFNSIEDAPFKKEESKDDKKREEINRKVRRMEGKELDKILEYLDFISSRIS